MGIALGKLKQKDEAKSVIKKAMHLKARTRPDIKVSRWMAFRFSVSDLHTYRIDY
jgi:hypothetical protein